MNYSEAYRYGLKKLKDSGIDNAEFDNRMIFENCFGLDRIQLAIKSEQQAQKDNEDKFLNDLDARISGEPLQYILGLWEFMGLDFYVGKGVLIPREETELLVREVNRELKKSSDEKIIFDLCSGSGCVGISIAKLCENCKVYLIEKSKDAIKYLEKNVAKNNLSNITIVEGDITKGFEYFNLPQPNIIISNPPYIKSQDIKQLQNEVKREPIMALDGGNDGLDFYRILAQKWMPFILENGMIAVEIGDGQADEVCMIFSQIFSKITKKQDFSEIMRVVIARK
ncbi:MAG: peptide chain release factor N(5)-glutamine methyltransferase [Clostridia bacterium]|nr:peptide chain release factor N(5)-glutamine methyltransferase [Clostridia bacterium]